MTKSTQTIGAAPTRAERKAALQTELNQILAEEEAERKVALEIRNKVLLAGIDTLLALAPTHSSSCADDHRYRHRCTRCALLDIRDDADWQGWPEEAHIHLEINWPHDKRA